ncbi:T9SS type A sorting domain-containing protein [uncultured Chryseobacterium sp.]|uniref:T9SS type A sorting domain-containing protein n=1 Tax=uncultured Chryseobacterium sp. TaxID=259322 RepID=UPI0025D79FC2|nr:T9SS type A sorting domain-containing protein [uncultured Chryseobacterium sp.]
MKKALFLIMMGVLSQAQTPDLISASWYISNITVNGQSTNTPAMDVGVGTSSFSVNGSGNNYIFNSRYFNSAPVSITFIPGTNTFSKNGSGCTLAYYMGNNYVAVNIFDQKNCDMFGNPPAGTIYSYQVVQNGSGKTLTITDPSGNKISYNSFVLETTDTKTQNQTFRAYPNPVKESLTIEGIQKNLTIKIYDASGKLVSESRSTGERIQLEAGYLPKGQYIITIDTYAPYTFIKE